MLHFNGEKLSSLRYASAGKLAVLLRFRSRRRSFHTPVSLAMQGLWSPLETSPEIAKLPAYFIGNWRSVVSRSQALWPLYILRAFEQTLVTSSQEDLPGQL